MFSKYVSEQLKFYVYRLIDPRNGETFYVGKGKDNRVFQHVKGELTGGGDDLNEKITRIREIRLSNFEVGHVIHRHGMTEEQALEVEAALIDAYPEASNQVGGHYSDERGIMHANQILENYEAKEAEFRHKAILITINRSATQRESIYAAVRYAWKIDAKKAAKAEVILAVQQGVIVGAFIAERWLTATVANFPDTIADRPGRSGFVGRAAPETMSSLYLRKRIPNALRKRGAANPVRYVF